MGTFPLPRPETMESVGNSQDTHTRLPMVDNAAPRLILASQSPRRRYLLKQAGLTFSVIPSRFDEASVQLADPSAYVKTLATNKAAEVAARFPESVVLGADTIVTIDGAILGKPADPREARAMLQRLSGQSGYNWICTDNKPSSLAVMPISGLGWFGGSVRCISLQGWPIPIARLNLKNVTDWPSSKP